MARKHAGMGALLLAFVVVVVSFVLAGFSTPGPESVPELEPMYAEPVTEEVQTATAETHDSSQASNQELEGEGANESSEGEDGLFEITDADFKVNRSFAGAPKAPEHVRGIYVSSWASGNQAKLDQLIKLARETEINSFVLDIKDVTGEVSYSSSIPFAQKIGATENIRIGSMPRLLERLKEEGIFPIARIVVFKDPLLASARPDFSILREDGSLWEDQKGTHWIDPFQQGVWDYNIALAEEAIRMGFGEIQWDYIRFPDAPGSYMRQAVYPGQNGRDRTDAIHGFLDYSREKLGKYGVPLTADVFGVTTSAKHDVGIGQIWEPFSSRVDVMLPMVYPSHYWKNAYGFEKPNYHPYEIVNTALTHAVQRSEKMERAARIRPWLQDFNYTKPDYTPAHVRAQIEATYDAGVYEWVLWHPGSRYTRAALATADGTAPVFARPGREFEAPIPEPETNILGEEVPTLKDKMGSRVRDSWIIIGNDTIYQR